MNFKTTIILVAILIVVGIYFLFTRDTQQRTDAQQTQQAERSLLDIRPEDVTSLSIIAAEGDTLSFEKKDGQWRMISPANAQAESYQVDSLVRQIAELTTRGQVDANDATGLSSPSYTVELNTRTNRTIRLAIGTRSALGDHMYVRVGDSERADVVPASIHDTLRQPAGKYRRTRLVDEAASQITQISIQRDGATLSLQKDNGKWQIVEPRRMPADSSAASDLTYAISGLTATEFVKDPPSAAHGLEEPVMTVWFSTEQPTTQPATQPAGTTIRLGRYDDILRKNVFASVSTAPDAVVKVAATVLDSFNKTALDLRDRNVLAISHDTIQRITLQRYLAATTQPTTRPASSATLTFERRVEQPPPTTTPTTNAGTEEPTTQIATHPATMASTQVAAEPASTQPATQASADLPSTEPATQAATQPAPEPVVKWVLTSSAPEQTIDQSKLNSILNALNPLRARRFLEQAPATTQPAGTYTLTIASGTDSARTEHQIRITDPGDDAAPFATHDDLIFEIDRSLVNSLNEDFAIEQSTTQSQ